MPEMKVPERIEPGSLDDHLEVMSKAIFQAGMSWSVVGNKWAGIRDVLLGFNPDAIASLDDAQIDEVASDRRIIRNQRKIGAIVENARAMIAFDRNPTSVGIRIRTPSLSCCDARSICPDARCPGIDSSPWEGSWIRKRGSDPTYDIRRQWDAACRGHPPRLRRGLHAAPS